MVKRNLIAEIISILFILLWGYAGISKLIDYSEFRMQLGLSPFITEFSHLLSWTLPISEIGIAVLLIFSKTQLTGLYFSLFLMTLFSVYIYTMLHHSYYIPCSCGGILGKMQWKPHLYFNLFFVLLAIIGILYNQKRSSYKQYVKDKIAIS